MKNKVIGVFSAKGGVGKTTTAINIASALHQFGRYVLLMDIDLISPNLSMYLGGYEVPNSLHAVLGGRAKIQDAIYMHNSGINLIVGSINLHDDESFDFSDVNKEIERLGGKYELLLIDSSPGHDMKTLSNLSAIDSFIIVSTPELAAVTDALRTIIMLKRLNREILGVVLTRVGNHEHEMNKENIEAMLGTKVIASIPEDKNVPLSAKVKTPVVSMNSDSRASVAYKELAAQLLGEKYIHKIEKVKSKNIFNDVIGRLSLQ